MAPTPLAIAVAVILGLPWLGLVGLGGYWLWQHGWLYHGLGALFASVALASALVGWRRRGVRPPLLKLAPVAANPNWCGQDQLAWQGVAEVCARWQPQANVLTDGHRLWALTNEVLTTVARHYHADSPHPILEFPLPYLLKLVTLVCDDLQREVLDKIPGSHAIRVVDLLRAKQTMDTLDQLKSLFSVGHWLFNWPGAALAKARELLFKKGVAKVTGELSRHLLKLYIEKLGYYAIQLYSGQITLDDWTPETTRTLASRTDLEQTANAAGAEPLRLLLMGQVSCGKSSVLNALLGHIRGATSRLPTTAQTTPHVLERDGLPQAVILDSVGYAGVDAAQAGAAPQQHWANTDVVLVVLKANQAARDADRRQLDALRAYFQTQRRDLALPVIIAVVTHIDQLRPLREWRPPYNIQQPDTAKAASIRQACLSIAEALQLPLTRVVPVCLAEDKPHYNIDDGLLPVIHEHLDSAQRVRYLRCLRDHQKASHWRHWRKQMRRLGQVILDIS